MSFASISRAANDPDLISRVTAAAQKEIVFNDDLANTEFGKALRRAGGALSPVVAPLMWPIAVDTELAYETAVNAGRGAPGYDQDVIPDAAITSAVITHWPYADGEGPPPEV